MCCCFCPKTPSKKQRLLNKAASANEENDLSSSTELENVPVDNTEANVHTTSSASDGTVSLFSEEFYTQTERAAINFTKSKIIEIINDEFDDSKASSYKQFYNQNGLHLSFSSSGSALNNAIQMVRMSYTIPKSVFPPSTTISRIADAMNSESHRLQWDTSLKEYKILSKHETFYVVYTRMSKPMAFVSERDLLEKKTEFYHGGSFYSSCSSFINDSVKGEVEDVQRIVNYFSGFKISEDSANFYFSSLNQIDYKMSLPQSLLNGVLPTSLTKWYTSLSKYLHSKYTA